MRPSSLRPIHRQRCPDWAPSCTPYERAQRDDHRPPAWGLPSAHWEERVAPFDRSVSGTGIGIGIGIDRARPVAAGLWPLAVRGFLLPTEIQFMRREKTTKRIPPVAGTIWVADTGDLGCFFFTRTRDRGRWMMGRSRRWRGSC
jgi:hypothetical protein